MEDEEGEDDVGREGGGGGDEGRGREEGVLVMKEEGGRTRQTCDCIRGKF